MIRIICLLLLLCPYISNAQVQTIKGNVTDVKTGQALGGITICAALNNKQTISLSDGSWQLTVQQLPDTVYFSAAGYSNQQRLVISTQPFFNIAMQPLATLLQEVNINSGYQTFKLPVSEPFPLIFCQQY